MKNAIDYILSNLVFITRLPIRVSFHYRSDAGNVKFFPLVGVVLGIISAMVGWMSIRLFGSLVAAVMVTITMMMLTGGIHLDGLSDSADGLLSYREKDRIIEIMKDSRIGAMGVLALFSVLLLKVAFLEYFLREGLGFFVLLFPICGRISIVNACYLGRPITQSKLGAGFIGNMGRREWLYIQGAYLGVMALLVLLFGQSISQFIPRIVALGITLGLLFIASEYFVKRVTNRLDGISGDILGAVCELGEVFSFPFFYIGVWLCDKLL